MLTDDLEKKIGALLIQELRKRGGEIPEAEADSLRELLGKTVREVPNVVRVHVSNDVDTSVMTISVELSDDRTVQEELLYTDLESEDGGEGAVKRCTDRIIQKVTT